MSHYCGKPLFPCCGRKWSWICPHKKTRRAVINGLRNIFRRSLVLMQYALSQSKSHACAVACIRNTLYSSCATVLPSLRVNSGGCSLSSHALETCQLQKHLEQGTEHVLRARRLPFNWGLNRLQMVCPRQLHAVLPSLYKQQVQAIYERTLLCDLHVR